MDLLSELSGPFITGGAWGTELQAHGLPSGASPDSWNVIRPHVIEEIAAQYVECGSSVVLTNTFQANRVALARQGLDHDTGRINRLGVVYVRRGVDHRALVFGSMGPTGSDSWMEQNAAYREQADVLAEANAFGLVIETMTSLSEARIALEAALATGLRVAVSFAVGFSGPPDRLASGESLAKAVEEMADRGASYVGLNCMDARLMLPLCEELSSTIDVPLWMKPNAGQPIVIDGLPRYGLTPVEFGQKARELVDAGASYVGGCCGVGPDHIFALHAALKGPEEA